MAKQKGGHPALKDPQVAKLHRTMTSAVELVRDLEGRLTPEQLDYLKGSSAGLMFCYSALTGQPTPIQIAIGDSHHD